MATVIARRAMTSGGRERPGAARSSYLPLTLADLITAIQDVVGPEDDGLVVATVRHLLGAGRLTGRGPGALPIDHWKGREGYGRGLVGRRRARGARKTEGVRGRRPAPVRGAGEQRPPYPQLPGKASWNLLRRFE
jgi:hypothetical protein